MVPGTVSWLMLRPRAMRSGIQLAHLQRGQRMDRLSQSSSQKELLRSEDHKLPSAQAEPVAQCHRAQRIHGKRNVVQPDRLLTSYELADSVCGAFDCPRYEQLSIPESAA